MVKGRGRTAREATRAKVSPRSGNVIIAAAPPDTDLKGGSAALAKASSIMSTTSGVSAPLSVSGYDPTSDPFWKEAGEALDALRIRHTLIRTRAEFESLNAHIPSEVTLVSKLMSLADAENLSLPEVAVVVKERFEKAYAEWVTSSDNFLANDPVKEAPELSFDDRFRMEALLTETIRKHGQGSFLAYRNGIRELRKKVDPEWGARTVEGVRRPYEARKRTAVDTALLVVGWGGRPLSIEKAAKVENIGKKTVVNRLKKAEEHLGYSVEELRRMVAHKNGRRYLWPDERAGTYRKIDPAEGKV